MIACLCSAIAEIAEIKVGLVILPHERCVGDND